MIWAVSPGSEKAVLVDDLLHKEEIVGDVDCVENNVRDHNEDHVVPRPILGSKDYLAKKNAVLEEAHEYDPVSDEDVLRLLFRAHI